MRTWFDLQYVEERSFAIQLMSLVGDTIHIPSGVVRAKRFSFPIHHVRTPYSSLIRFKCIVCRSVSGDWLYYRRNVVACACSVCCLDWSVCAPTVLHHLWGTVRDVVAITRGIILGSQAYCRGWYSGCMGWRGVHSASIMGHGLRGVVS